MPETSSSSDVVSFNVYVNRGVASKAGWAGELTTTSLKTADAGGFGVFGYYTNGVLYNNSSKPDFMYNQQVAYDGSQWAYSPVKYWPNEFGASASSQSSDRLTFFAYAPYAAVNPTTGLVTGDTESGIISMTRNIAEGDPLVRYSASLKPGAGVDLCWGVAGADFVSSVDGENNHVLKGDPFKDLIKPKTGDKITFEFNHALAQFNVQIDADIDVESHAAGTLADGTKIFVRSVSFTGFTTQGSLNLNSQAGKPSWYDLTGTGRLSRDPVTIYDGRTDGLEGGSSASDWNEKPTGLNPVLVQDGTAKAGVTNTAVNLFDSTSAEAPVLVIPTAGVPLKVTIDYDIETVDPSLPGYLADGITHGLSIENKISRTVVLSDGSDMTISSGKKYVLKLHLGMTSVKFDAEVADWDDTDHSANVDLPVNTAALGSITLTDANGNPVSDVTVWKDNTVSNPTVKVFSDDGTEMTSSVSITYSSNNTSVASVGEDGAVAITGTPGTATITVKAEHNDMSISKTYDVCVNAVTAVTVAPATADIYVGSSAALTATLEINGGNGVNGTLITLPTVAWTSGYDKVTVDPTSAAATDTGTAIVATTTATAAGDAESAHQAEITATVGSPYASSDLSDTATLTCVDKITIASVDLSASSTTVWFTEGASLPTVTVMGTDGQALTTGITLAWTAKNPDVATYDATSGITLVESGTAVFEVTATLAESPTTAASTKTAEYTVYVNKVNGVTVTPASSSLVIGMTPGQTETLTATLTYNDGSNSPLGSVTSWPTVTWSSSDACITLDPLTGTVSSSSPAVATVASLATSAAAGQSSTITATVGSSFVKESVSGTATVNCVDPVTINTVTLSSTSTTVWKADNTVTTPTITSVIGSDNSDLTSVATVVWSYDDSSIAEVAEQGGAITLHAAGVIQIVATVSIPVSAASPAGDSKQVIFTVNSNEVTGISVDPTTATVPVNGTANIETEITMTQNGDYATLFMNTPPPVTWDSASQAYVTVTPSASGRTAVAMGVAKGGSSVVSATIPATYTNTGVDLTATCIVTCSNPSGTGNGFSQGWNQ